MYNIVLYNIITYVYKNDRAHFLEKIKFIRLLLLSSSRRHLATIQIRIRWAISIEYKLKKLLSEYRKSYS